jgi:hypothetical protein
MKNVVIENSKNRELAIYRDILKSNIFSAYLIHTFCFVCWYLYKAILSESF